MNTNFAKVSASSRLYSLSSQSNMSRTYLRSMAICVFIATISQKFITKVSTEKLLLKKMSLYDAFCLQLPFKCQIFAAWLGKDCLFQSNYIIYTNVYQSLIFLNKR